MSQTYKTKVTWGNFTEWHPAPNLAAALKIETQTCTRNPECAVCGN